jgi:hypothetical protein
LALGPSSAERLAAEDLAHLHQVFALKPARVAFLDNATARADHHQLGHAVPREPVNDRKSADVMTVQSGQ